ncbi:MAG: T9SS type A sorting domain-containing protein, partial [candidate division Zixibacteria bacterium]|nr:T9SS type A sorting domain-containing protein [candidate division Zixibacteria bacterium]
FSGAPYYGSFVELAFSDQAGLFEFVPVFVNHREGLVAKPLGVVEVPGATVPTEFRLSQNYPNPFNPETNIDFSLAEVSDVNVTIYNILGQRVKTLVDEKGLRPGVYNTRWDSTNNNGEPVASGVYLYRIVAGNKTAVTKKMTLLR